MIEIQKVQGAFWTAAHVRARCEKVLQEYCERRGVVCYLPLLRKAKRYQRRTVETFLPMFPGYVFVCVDESARTIVLNSHKVAWIAPMDALQERVLVAELQGLQRLEQFARDAEIVVLPELAPGKSVGICSGPLQGVHGIVERRLNKTRVTVNVELLGQAASVDLDVGELELDEDG